MTCTEQDFGTLHSIALVATGFVARSIVQWYLQKSKAREAMLRAFSGQRARSLKSLWSKTSLFDPPTEIQMDDEWRRKQCAQFTDWYFNESGALFLSHRATKLYFRALETIEEGGSKKSMQKNFSALRTQLKWDIGIYSWWESLKPVWPKKKDPQGNQLPPSA